MKQQKIIWRDDKPVRLSTKKYHRAKRLVIVQNPDGSASYKEVKEA